MGRKRHGNYTGGKIFGAPIWSPESKVTFLCYPGDGVNRVFSLPHSAQVHILAVNSARETRWEDGHTDWRRVLFCPALAKDESWRQLSWVMADGSLPLRELQKVDPFMAQFNHLPRVDITSVYRGAPRPNTK